MTRSAHVPSLVLLAVLCAACRGGGGGGPITVSGYVEATDVRIAAKVGGRLVQFGLSEGDRVTPGQVIALIDATDTELAIATAKGERDAFAADLKLKEAGARQEDIAEARAHLASVEADLDGAQRDLDRMQQLLDSGSGTTKSRDDALTRRDATKAQLAAAREALTRLERGFRPEEIAAARGRLAAAEARIGQLEQQVKDATVVSPVAGVLTEKIAEQGELLGPGSLLCVVNDLADAWLTVYIGEPELPRVRLGAPVEVTTDSGQRRTGKVTFVASQAEFTPKNVQTKDERVKLVYKVKVGLPNDDGLFKPGMPAQAVFAEEVSGR